MSSTASAPTVRLPYCNEVASRGALDDARPPCRYAIFLDYRAVVPELPEPESEDEEEEDEEEDVEVPEATSVCNFLCLIIW